MLFFFHTCLASEPRTLMVKLRYTKFKHRHCFSGGGDKLPGDDNQKSELKKNEKNKYISNWNVGESH